MPARTLGTTLISREAIQRRIAELGRQVSGDYRGRAVTFVAILKGSVIFASDLLRALDTELICTIDFIAVSSYGDSTTSSGTVHIQKDLDTSVEGKDVIIVEDIVDTGLTLQHVYNIVSGRGARSIRIATLLEKPGKIQHPLTLHYVGFQIPNEFVVGFGLDYAERYRNLPEVRILDEI